MEKQSCSFKCKNKPSTSGTSYWDRGFVRATGVELHVVRLSIMLTSDNKSSINKSKLQSNVVLQTNNEGQKDCQRPHWVQEI